MTKFNALKESMFFIKTAVLQPNEVASFFPSTKTLIKAIVNKAGISDAKYIVELGPGTGGTTKGFLEQMQSNSELCIIETNKNFADYLKKNIKDKRLYVCHDNAQNMTNIIQNIDWEYADVIVSGIPFSTMPENIAKDIMSSIYDCLKPGGIFVAYQLRDKVGKLANPFFGKATIQWEYKSFPPMRIFVWEK